MKYFLPSLYMGYINSFTQSLNLSLDFRAGIKGLALRKSVKSIMVLVS